MTRLKVLLAAAGVSAALALSGSDSSAAPAPAGSHQASTGGGAVPAVTTDLLAPGHDWQRYGVYDVRRGTWNLISRGTPLVPPGKGC